MAVYPIHFIFFLNDLWPCSLDENRQIGTGVPFPHSTQHCVVVVLGCHINQVPFPIMRHMGLSNMNVDHQDKTFEIRT